MALPITTEILEGKKLDLQTIEKMVVKNGFGVTTFTHKGVLSAISHGINYALLSKSFEIADVERALDRFLSGDFGTFYCEDEEPVVGCEYGCYASKFGDTPSSGAIMVHRENSPRASWEVVAYFQFER